MNLPDGLIVVITSEMCRNFGYGSKMGCPLAEAIKEVLHLDIPNGYVEVDNLDEYHVDHASLTKSTVGIYSGTPMFGNSVFEGGYVTKEPWNRILYEKLKEKSENLITLTLIKR